MFKHKIDTAERTQILDFLKRLSDDLNTSIGISKNANRLSEKVLSRPRTIEIEEFKKQWLESMDRLEEILNHTGETETYLPAVNDKKGTGLLFDLQTKASEYYACQIGNLRMHLNGVEAKLNGNPDPLEKQVIKRSNDSVIKAFDQLLKFAAGLAAHYHISDTEWKF